MSKLGVVKGQKIATRMLLNDLERGRLPQTLLFYGPEGSGKFLTAHEIARVVNCRQNGDPECDCESCRIVRNFTAPYVNIISAIDLGKNFELWLRYGVRENSFPYFFRDVMRLIYQKQRDIFKLSLKNENKKKYQKLIEKIESQISFIRERVSSYKIFNESIEDVFSVIEEFIKREKDPQILIDEIRNIGSFLNRKAVGSEKKVVIIDGAEYMNEMAANSFLKISEDTSPDSMIIMTAVDKKMIKPTILSRARIYRFIPLDINIKKSIYSLIFGRDIDPDETEEERKVVENYLFELKRSKGDFVSILNVVQDIIKNSLEGYFIDYLIRGLRETLNSGYNDIEQIYYIETRLKALIDEKEKLQKTNVNRELSFTNFIINELL